MLSVMGMVFASRMIRGFPLLSIKAAIVPGQKALW